MSLREFSPVLHETPKKIVGNFGRPKERTAFYISFGKMINEKYLKWSWIMNDVCVNLSGCTRIEKKNTVQGYKPWE